MNIGKVNNPSKILSSCITLSTVLIIAINRMLKCTMDIDWKSNLGFPRLVKDHQIMNTVWWTLRLWRSILIYDFIYFSILVFFRKNFSPLQLCRMLPWFWQQLSEDQIIWQKNKPSDHLEACWHKCTWRKLDTVCD